MWEFLSFQILLFVSGIWRCSSHPARASLQPGKAVGEQLARLWFWGGTQVLSFAFPHWLSRGLPLFLVPVALNRQLLGLSWRNPTLNFLVWPFPYLSRITRWAIWSDFPLIQSFLFRVFNKFWPINTTFVFSRAATDSFLFICFVPL